MKPILAPKQPEGWDVSFILSPLNQWYYGARLRTNASSRNVHHTVESGYRNVGGPKIMSKILGVLLYCGIKGGCIICRIYSKKKIE
jgi:hypothetical protein